jgi:LysM repeat protein
VGQKLLLPESGSTLPEVAPAAPAKTPAAVLAGGARHTVRSGETLGQIARKYGITVSELAVANHIADPTRIRAGQELVIPGARAAEAAPATPVETPAPAVPAPAEEAAPVIRPASEVPVIRIEDTAPPAPEPPPAR